MRNYIANKLIGWEFQQDENIFLKETIHTVPGRQIVINGQRADEPPQQVHLVFRVELVGKGSIEPPPEELEWVTWQVLQNENIVSQYTEALYNNDQNRFDLICGHLFGIQ